MTEQEADEKYTTRIAVPAQDIVQQNRCLIARARESDFKPDDELSYCKNGAITRINRFFEAASCYDEGRVPYWALTEMVETTELLLETLNGLPNAPLEEIDRVDTAFNEAMAIFADGHEAPRMDRKTYLKQVFAKRDRFFVALRELHEAYVRQLIASSARPKRHCRKRRVEADLQKVKRASDRSDVFDEITRLRKKGLSVAKALRSMRIRGTYAARLGRISDATWQRYYTARARPKPAK